MAYLLPGSLPGFRLGRRVLPAWRGVPCIAGTTSSKVAGRPGTRSFRLGLLCEVRVSAWGCLAVHWLPSLIVRFAGHDADHRRELRSTAHPSMQPAVAKAATDRQLRLACQADRSVITGHPTTNPGLGLSGDTSSERHKGFGASLLHCGQRRASEPGHPDHAVQQRRSRRDRRMNTGPSSRPVRSPPAAGPGIAQDPLGVLDRPALDVPANLAFAGAEFPPADHGLGEPDKIRQSPARPGKPKWRLQRGCRRSS